MGHIGTLTHDWHMTEQLCISSNLQSQTSAETSVCNRYKPDVPGTKWTCVSKLLYLILVPWYYFLYCDTATNFNLFLAQPHKKMNILVPITLDFGVVLFPIAWASGRPWRAVSQTRVQDSCQFIGLVHGKWERECCLLVLNLVSSTLPCMCVLVVYF